MPHIFFIASCILVTANQSMNHCAPAEAVLYGSEEDCAAHIGYFQSHYDHDDPDFFGKTALIRQYCVEVGRGLLRPN